MPSTQTERKETWQEANERKKRENAAAGRRVFAKKANDQQYHQNLLAHAEVAVDAYQRDPLGSNTRAAMRELFSMMILSRKRLQP